MLPLPAVAGRRSRYSSSSLKNALFGRRPRCPATSDAHLPGCKLRFGFSGALLTSKNDAFQKRRKKSASSFRDLPTYARTAVALLSRYCPWGREIYSAKYSGVPRTGYGR